MTRLPIYTTDQIARYVQVENSGGEILDRHWALGGGGLTYNTTGLTRAGAYLADQAIAVYEAMTGINFRKTLAAANISFDDNQEDAFTNITFNGDGTIIRAAVNVSTAWLLQNGTAIGGYSFQTYLHEIGHALGLGHAGPYNETGNYVTDTTDFFYGRNSNIYLNDSWRASVMSYFAPDENTTIRGQHTYLITPMVADLIALESKYGSAAVFSGDTVWGFNTTIASTRFQDLAGYASRSAFLIVDRGGVDTIDFSGYGADQHIYLRPEAESDVGGLTANMTIARGTLIENAVGGSGNDVIIGGSLGNTLTGGLGNDRLAGRAGNDALSGGDGTDYLIGEEGNDLLDGGLGLDRAEGGAGNDLYRADRPADLAVETLRGAAGGSDTVISGYSYRLAANLEALILGGGRAGNLTGNELANRIVGNAASNLIAGHGGSDVLQAGGGADQLVGGTGADVFRFAAASQSTPVARDVIRGGDGAVAFELPGAATGDRIDLASVDANAALAGVQPFVLGGAHAVGHLWLADVGTDTMLSGNVRGAGAPEFQLAIADGAVRAATYSEADFIGLA